jgi:D-inositol-3-phosphate glycosyltransferase
VEKERLPELVDEFTSGVLEAVTDGPAPDLIHANYWLSGIAGHALKHKLELPLISTFHTLARVKAEAAEQESQMRARAEAEVIGCSDAILASSHDERAQLERLYDAVPHRIEIVPPGVDPTAFSPGDRAAARQALGLDDGRVLLFVGRILPLKGLDVAVGALASLDDPGATLVIVGGPSGPDGVAELERTRSLVTDAGLDDRVRFVEPQPHDRLRVFYRAADVCLVPSRAESFGLVALEAAACGLPVVAAAVGGLRTIVEHGRTGFLVEGRDPGAFAAFTGEILGNAALATEMAAHAVSGTARYRWPSTAARLRRIYADLTARQLVECS